jgi:hypothetical protein
MYKSTGFELNGWTSLEYPDNSDLHPLHKLTVFHADNHLFHLTVVSCRFQLSASLCLGFTLSDRKGDQFRVLLNHAHVLQLRDADAGDVKRFGSPLTRVAVVVKTPNVVLPFRTQLFQCGSMRFHCNKKS